MDEMKHIQQLKIFTVSEANEVIPHLSELLRRLQDKKKEIALLETEIDLREILRGSVPEAGPDPVVEKSLETYERLANEFYSLIDAVHQTGCVLKDVDVGLVDFYAVHQGRIVYLCWRLGESAVSAWHEIGKGYACRQQLEPEKDLLS